MKTYQNTTTFAQQVQNKQNVVDYRDSTATGMKEIKDDKVFVNEQNEGTQKLINQGKQVADSLTQNHLTWRQKFSNFLHHIQNELPSHKLINENLKLTPGYSKVSDILQKGEVLGTDNNISGHLAERQDKYKIADSLLFQNPHLNENINLETRNKLPSYKNTVDSEIRNNFEHKYGLQSSDTYTYIDNPFLKVVDDVYHNHKTMSNIDLGEAGYIVKDQLKNNYDVDIQHQWNKRNQIYVKDNYNTPLSTYLGINKANAIKRQVMNHPVHTEKKFNKRKQAPQLKVNKEQIKQGHNIKQEERQMQNRNGLTR